MCMSISVSNKIKILKKSTLMVTKGSPLEHNLHS